MPLDHSLDLHRHRPLCKHGSELQRGSKRERKAVLISSSIGDKKKEINRVANGKGGNRQGKKSYLEGLANKRENEFFHVCVCMEIIIETSPSACLLSHLMALSCSGIDSP